MRTFFESHVDSPPAHPHLPPVTNKLLWLHGFKIHIQASIEIELSAVVFLLTLHNSNPFSLKVMDASDSMYQSLKGHCKKSIIY